MNDATERFCARFGVAVPLVNAPMARVAGGALARAVNDAGALGLIGGGYGDLDWIGEQLALAGDASVGVGLITWAVRDRPQLIEVLIARGVRTFFLSFGDPSAFVDVVRRANGRVVFQAQTLPEVQIAVASGVDAIAVQGIEAGGHGRDNVPTRDLLRMAIDIAADVPVLAAGGITTQSDVTEVLDLGAAAAVVGTRFYATHEALDIDAAKERLVSAADTVRTSVFDLLRGPEWPAGYNGRAVVNDAVRRWHGREDELRNRIDHERDAYAAAAADLGTRVVWAGAGVSRIGSIEHAADVVRALTPSL